MLGQFSRYSRNKTTFSNLKYFSATNDGPSLQKAFQRSVSANSPQPVQNELHKSAPISPPNNPSINTHQSFQPKPTPIASPTPKPPQPTGGPLYFLNNTNLLEFAPKITVVGVGGGGCNAINNMIQKQLVGVSFVAANTDAQHLATTLTDRRIQLGRSSTQGLGCGANPEVGRIAAEESRQEIEDMIGDSHMVFITAGMGGGTGTGAAPVVAEICMKKGILTVAVVTKPFSFEGRHRMRLANEGLRALQDRTDTLIVVPNQNLFSIVDRSTSMEGAFTLANDVLLAGVKSITELVVKPGMINLDFADIQSVMSGMGNAIMGTGQASGEDRAIRAATDALKNPLLGSEMNVKSAKGVLVNISGGNDLSLFEVDQAANHITSEIEDENANIIFGALTDPELEGQIRVSVVATGIDTKF